LSFRQGQVLGPPPGVATHWTGRMLAKAAGMSLRSVQRILEAHQLAPHRIRTFKLSNDPKFAEKLKDVVGLYVEPREPLDVLVGRVVPLNIASLLLCRFGQIDREMLDQFLSAFPSVTMPRLISSETLRRLAVVP
jgi:hypothetical protein